MRPTVTNRTPASISLRDCKQSVPIWPLIFFPLAAPLVALLRRLEPAEPNDEERETEQEEEVEAYIEAGEREGLLEEEEGKMMRGIVDLDETRVREIMTPRTDIVAIASDATVAQARAGVVEGMGSGIGGVT